MSPRYSTKRTPDSPENKKTDSRAKPNTRSSARPITYRQVLIMCLLPFWFATIVVFDMALAEYHERNFSTPVRLNVTELRQEQLRDDKSLPSYFVDLNEQGDIVGRISEIDQGAVNNLEVVLVQEGVVKYRSDKKTDASGQFVLENVRAGQDYTFVASGRSGFLAYSVHVNRKQADIDPDFTDTKANIRNLRRQSRYVSFLEPQSLNDIQDSEVDDTLNGIENEIQESEIDATLNEIENENQDSEINDALNEIENEILENGQIEPLDDAPAEVANQEEVREFQVDAAAIPPQFTVLQGIVDGVSLGVIPGDAGDADDEEGEIPPTDDYKFAGGFEFQLENGNFLGRVEIQGGNRRGFDRDRLRVDLLKDDIRARPTVEVEEDGKFQFDDVKPGIYAVVVSGKDGFAAMSVKLVGTDNEASNELGELSDSGEHYVSTRKKQAAVAFHVSLITDSEDIRYCQKRIREINDERRLAGFRNPIGPSPSRLGQGNFGVPSASGGFAAPGGGLSPPATGGFSPATGGLGRAIGGRGLRRALILTTAIVLPIAITEPRQVSPSERR